MSVSILQNCAIATIDAARREFSTGHVVVEGNRIVAVGPGAAPERFVKGAARRFDLGGCLVTPGLVNCHHHLYQFATRGQVCDGTLFQWLTALYPVWARIDEDIVVAAARAGLAMLLRSGCSTTTDHHYVFPASAGDLFAAEVDTARALGIRFHPCRGAMDLGQSDGGLPPDSLVEDRDTILAAYEDVVARFHDTSPGAMTRVALAPTSPFSVTRELLVETAELARRLGVRLHTHVAETVDEQDFCREHFGMRPLEYLEDAGWLGGDVWLAHCIHLNDSECARMGHTGTGAAHCPSSNGRLGAGIAPVPRLLGAGAPVGLGVDGAASNESGALAEELRTALILGRAAAGPTALGVRDVLEMATLHGARCLARDDEIGHLSVGALADIAVWRLDDLARAGIEDPVAALVLATAPQVELLIVDGRVVVESGELRTADEFALASALALASRRLGEAAIA